MRTVRDQAVRAAAVALDTKSGAASVEASNPWILFGFWALSVRFGHSEFSRLREQALRLVDMTSPIDRVQLRLLDPAARPIPEDLNQASGLTRVIGDALACDLPWSSGPNLRALQDGVDAGGYMATHVGIALETRRQLGCDVSGTEGITAQLVSEWKRSTSPEARNRILRDQPDGVDLLFEQMSFLATLGGPDQLTEDMVRDVIRSREMNGIWPTLHTTQLAIAILDQWLGDDTDSTFIQ